jgi:hypothetical protein
MNKVNERLSESLLGTDDLLDPSTDTAEHFTPYQLILGTFTILYALRHLDDLFGLGGKWQLTG